MFWKGFLMSFLIYLIENILDVVLCFDEIENFQTTQMELYFDAKTIEFFNVIIIAPMLYGIFGPMILDENDFTFQWFAFFQIIFIQNILYFCIHRYMHITNASIHKFHHLFQDQVFPSTANTVSVSEFLVAYLLPLFAGACLSKTNEVTFLSASYTISMFNILVHIKQLENIPYPQYLVSPLKHLDHHKRKTKNYASPILDVEWFIVDGKMNF
mgnify:FL=1